MHTNRVAFWTTPVWTIVWIYHYLIWFTAHAHNLVFLFSSKKEEQRICWHLSSTSWKRRDIFYSIAYMRPALNVFYMSASSRIIDPVQCLHIIPHAHILSPSLDMHNTHLFDSDLFVSHIVRMRVFSLRNSFFLDSDFHWAKRFLLPVWVESVL